MKEKIKEIFREAIKSKKLDKDIDEELTNMFIVFVNLLHRNNKELEDFLLKFYEGIISEDVKDEDLKKQYSRDWLEGLKKHGFDFDDLIKEIVYAGKFDEFCKIIEKYYHIAEDFRRVHKYCFLK